MNFYDFQISAWQSGVDHVQVMVHSSPAGNMRRPVSVLFDAQKSDDLRRVFQESGWYSQHGIDQGLVELGRHLASVILPRPVYVLLMSSLERIPPDGGLRLRLCLDESLVDLPWEYVYRPDNQDPGSLGGFLCLDPRISLVREAPATTLKISASNVDQRMVFAGAFWSGHRDQWRVVGEYEDLGEALAPVGDLLDLDFVTAAEDHIEDALREPTAIFHYSGHTDVARGRGYLVREVAGVDANRQAYDPLYSERLADFLQGAGTRLAVFSACNSGRWPFVEPLIRAGLPALVGTQGTVTVRAANAFCEKLYLSLAVGLSLDEAVTWARLHVLNGAGFSGETSLEWGAFMVYMPTMEPILFPRSGDGLNREQEATRNARQDTIDGVYAAVGEVQSGRLAVDKRALRQTIVESFDVEEVETLCADVQQDLDEDGIALQVSLEMVGGTGKTARVRRLIDYLDRRGYLGYLVDAVRRARPGTI
jgi:hypothetical protein